MVLLVIDGKKDEHHNLFGDFTLFMCNFFSLHLLPKSLFPGYLKNMKNQVRWKADHFFILHIQSYSFV